MELIYFRGIERLLVVLFAGISIILGWHLFNKNIQNKHAEGTIKWGELIFEIKSAAPGIFFALFGSYVLFSSFSHPLKLGTKASNDKNIEESHNESLINGAIYYDEQKHTYFFNLVNKLEEYVKEECKNYKVKHQCKLYSITDGIKYYRDNVLPIVLFGEKTIENASRNLSIEDIEDKKEADKLSKYYDLTNKGD